MSVRHRGMLNANKTWHKMSGLCNQVLVCYFVPLKFVRMLQLFRKLQHALEGSTEIL